MIVIDAMVDVEPEMAEMQTAALMGKGQVIIMNGN
jgi:hypothetical protein